MSSLNQCSFIGNLGKDPEVRLLQNGKKVASFSIATSEKWKDKNTGEVKEKTEWIPCTCFDLLAGVIERFVRKGSKIFVQGQFTTRSWDDQQGVKHYKSEIQVRDLVMLDKKENQGNQGGYSAPSQNNQSASAYSNQQDDDLPF